MKRREKLFAEELISQEQLDHARRDYEVAKSKLKGAEEDLSLKKNIYRPEEIALARYNAVEARAALETAQIRLDYAVIRSPISGVVATVAMQNGEAVSVGLQAPTLVTIIDLERLQVEAYVDEVDIGRVEVGSPATFTVDTYPDKTFKGKVQAIYPKAVQEDNVVNYLTIISFTNPPGTLRPGMTTNVNIQIQNKEVAGREVDEGGAGAMAASKR
jgi:HlyD family secretion protein